jgi:hypothetical protein
MQLLISVSTMVKAMALTHAAIAALPIFIKQY